MARQVGFARPLDLGQSVLGCFAPPDVGDEPSAWIDGPTGVVARRRQSERAAAFAERMMVCTSPCRRKSSPGLWRVGILQRAGDDFGGRGGASLMSTITGLPS